MRLSVGRQLAGSKKHAKNGADDHLLVLIDDDDKTTRIKIWRVVLPQ